MSKLRSLSTFALTILLALGATTLSFASARKGSAKPATAATETSTSKPKKHHRKHRSANTVATSYKKVPKAKSLNTESY
jgi:hypothetical protein